MTSFAGRIVRDDGIRAAFEKNATKTLAVVGGVGSQATACGTSLTSAVATRTSPRWPGVTSMAIGRPRASTMAWIVVDVDPFALDARLLTQFGGAQPGREAFVPPP
jgi:hypothetical protein